MAITAGIYLLNQLLPIKERFKESDIVTSSSLKKRLTNFAKEDPKLYKKNISKIMKLGERISYFLGSNIGLEDLTIDGINTKEEVSRVSKNISSAGSKEEKREAMLDGFNSIVDKVVGLTKKKSSNEIISQVASGSRGNPAQVARTSISPIYAVDMKQLPKELVIKNNFSSGLSPVEYFNVASQGRFSSVSSANATAEPGALSKIIIANVEDQSIFERDCGTQNGILMDNDDTHIIGRYTAGSGGVLIDSTMFLKISRKKGKTKVRSPGTCESSRGVCIKCYGVRSNGKLPSIGDDVGIEAGQTVGQILTQMVLSTKHSTMGKNTGETKLEGVSGFNSLFSSNESNIGMATISLNNGVVSSVSKSTNGNTTIKIGIKKYEIKKGKHIIVNVGDHIKVGQTLTSGIVSPKEFLRRDGLYKAREEEAKEAHAIFKRSTGKDLQKKHFELISRGHFSVGVSRHGRHSSIDERMKDYPRRKRIYFTGNDMIGKYLAETIDYIPKGTEITEEFLGKLKKWNIRRVWVTDQRPPIKPIYKTLEQRPMFNNNLFGKLNYRGVKRAIKEQVVYNDDNSIYSGKSKYTGNF